MAEEKKLSGPDFTEGVSLTEFSDGGVLQGHTQGESILAARHADTFFAIGASCTHYGAPLAEGLMAEDTIRCPWHHACFSLRTGEALRAPALNPVSKWNVERRGDIVAVTNKVERDPLAATYPVSARTAHPRAVVIIGAGAAGAAAAEMLRRCGYEG